MGGDSWVFVALVTDAERRRFVDLLEEAEITGPSVSQLNQNDEGTSAALEALFMRRTADDWEAISLPAGVACVRADRMMPGEFWLNDSQVRANDFVAMAEHPVLGNYLRPGSLLHFDGEAPTLTGPPMAGEHGAAIVAQMGYSADEFAGHWWPR